ncbi:class I SAM-dependent methyltransferase [Evansella tamaricis]|uniref:Class I SAM-dependent methyltransferase n=1 Tax=Evansella tamaricis TaxID=2069301 RepID=A0ABS6JB63_9BACI|nr:class I SAM-dependent methyltransferase [Evansella tamaricis]MBU9710922.1 class I SAM-dependent methyltransferase [Evansella tamaricis]
MVKSVVTAFDVLSEYYADSVDNGASPYNSHYERPAMLQEIPEHLEGWKVLDAGCAAGWYSEKLTERGAQVSGIDLSPKMIEAAKKRFNVKGTFLCHDIRQALPFKDDEFDFILSSLTLHYIKDWEPTFREFHRVLKSGGFILFSVHHPFMDFTYFQCEDYFEKKRMSDTWKKGEWEVKVNYYRRTLQELIKDTTKFFSLDKLVEPQPVEGFKEIHPKAYEYLMKNPHFVIIKGYKKS